MSNNEQQQNKYAFHVSEEGTFTPRPLVRSSAVAEVPPGVYTLVCEEKGPGRFDVFLRPENNFKLPERLYGNIKTDVDRYLRSYELNDRNLGIMLIGLRGSGKTLTLKSLAVKAIELGFIAININTKIPDEILTWFLSTITQSCVVNIDEYEKMYSGEKEQKAILSLLDGVDTGHKKIYCLTANTEEGISKHMFDRPTRIRYIRRFSRLEVPTVVDYVQTNLKNCNEDHLRAFIHLALADADHSNGMNFDSMAEYVREMNQFGGSLNDTLDIMATQGKKSWTYFEITGFVDGKKQYRSRGNGTHTGAYLNSDEYKINFTIQREELKAKDKPEDEDSYHLVPHTVVLTAEHFKHYGDAHDVVVYEQDGVEYHLRYLNHSATGVVDAEIKKEQNERLGKSSTGLPEFFTFSLAKRAEAKREALAGQSGTSSSTGPTSSSHPQPSTGDTMEIKGVHLKQTGDGYYAGAQPIEGETAPEVDIQIHPDVLDMAQQIVDQQQMNPRSISANVPPEAAKDFEGDSLNTGPSEGLQLGRFPSLGGKHRHTPTDDKPNN